MRRAGIVLSAAVAPLLGAACGTPEGSMAIVLGGETDTLSRAPAPTTLVVSTVDLTGNEKEVARSPLPSTGIDLGSLARDDIASVRVRGLLADGAEVVRGGSSFFQWGALEVSRLDVFVQRRSELARLPGGGPTFETPTLGVVAGRYVLQAQGTAVGLYDLQRSSTVTAVPTLPRIARSLATYGTSALVVDDAGASYVDLNDGRSAEVAVPAGGTYADVAGGLTVTADDGAQYVVGATRVAGGPTARVLRLSTGGDVSFLSLAAPREGACAAWVPGRGLLVWGGSAAAAGGEIVAAGAVTGAPLAYPPDDVRGCAAVALDGARVVVAAGRRATPTSFAATVDLACAAGCATSPWVGSAELVRADAALVGEGAALVVGDDAGGASHAYRVTANELREVQLRLPRRGARLVVNPSIAAAPTPTARAAVVVGGAATLEQYID